MAKPPEPAWVEKFLGEYTDSKGERCVFEVALVPFDQQGLCLVQLEPYPRECTAITDWAPLHLWPFLSELLGLDSESFGLGPWSSTTVRSEYDYKTGTWKVWSYYRVASVYWKGRGFTSERFWELAGKRTAR